VQRLAREIPGTPLIELERCDGGEVGVAQLAALSEQLAVTL
jgi:hypothetical protein